MKESPFLMGQYPPECWVFESGSLVRWTARFGGRAGASGLVGYSRGSRIEEGLFTGLN